MSHQEEDGCRATCDLVQRSRPSLPRGYEDATPGPVPLCISSSLEGPGGLLGVGGGVDHEEL